MEGRSGCAAPLLPSSGTLRAAGSTRSRIPGIGQPAQPAEVKLAPHRPRRRARTSCPSAASLNPLVHSLPLGHRVEGRSSPSQAFPSPPLGRIAASRRQLSASPDFSAAPRCRPRLLRSAATTPRLLSQSQERSRLRGIPGAPHLEARASPLPLPARATIGRWRPLPGHPGGAPWRQRGAGQEGSGTRSPTKCEEPRASPRRAPFPRTGVGARGSSRAAKPRPEPDTAPQVIQLVPRVAPLGPASRGVLRKSR